MEKKFLILLIAAVILVILVVLGVIVYSPQFLSKTISNLSGVNGVEENKIMAPPDPTKILKQGKKDYPEIIKGVISFLDTKGLFKTVVKVDGGKEYTIWPAEPKSVYESLGVKNGGRVEIQGRFSQDGNIEWFLMKPI